MSGTNDNSPNNGPWWRALVLAVIAAVTIVAVTLINRYSAIDAGRPTPATPVDVAEPTPPQAPALRITSLTSGGQVAFDPVVDGEASGPIEQVWLLIQTRETPPKCWVQGPTGLGEDRTWHIPAQFGRSPSLDSGSRFSVSAIAGPPGDTRPGQVSCALAPAVRSPSVEVTRQ